MTVARSFEDIGPIDGELRARISTAVEALSDEMFDTIRELVRIPSVCGNEGAMSERMQELYRAEGLAVETQTPDMDGLRGHPGFVDTRMSYEGRINVVARLKGSGRGRSLILNGHMDVVEPGDTSKWTRDPWGGEIDGGWMYGRGAGDMKAGLIANLFALKALRRLGLEPAGDLMFQAVIDEEAGGAGGTLALLEAGYLADGFIATEPTNFTVTVAHSGVCYFRVRVTGKQAHAGYAHKGVNALTRMGRIITALSDLDEERGKLRHELIGAGTPRACHLNVGTCRSGEWPSTVPAEAEIDCRMGFIPGESLAEIRALVARTVAEANAGDAWMEENPAEIEWYGWQTDPWQQDPEVPFIRAVRAETGAVTGSPAILRGATGGNDARFAAYYGMPSCCVGHYNENMHGIDERVNLPSVVKSTKILAGIIANWCGTVAVAKGRAE